MSADEWNTYFSGHWKFPGEKQSKHLATFPAELPNRLIRMFSFVDDTVLDPYLGSGTTSISAKDLNRNSIGIEINSDYVPLIKENFSKSDPEKLTTYEIRIENQDISDIDFQSRIKTLPYIFTDPHKLDKKIDPQQKSFGSRIN